MAITKPIFGKWITLRCAEESDAEFTLAIRNDLKLTKFIPKVNGDIESQKYWIRKQREKYGDYFFIIENKSHNSVGTISCYDFDYENNICEGGRYISYGDSIENIEAMLLLYDFIFIEQKFSTIVMNVDENNRKVLRNQFAGCFGINAWPVKWSYSNRGTGNDGSTEAGMSFESLELSHEGFNREK